MNKEEIIKVLRKNAIEYLNGDINIGLSEFDKVAEEILSLQQKESEERMVKCNLSLNIECSFRGKDAVSCRKVDPCEWKYI